MSDEESILEKIKALTAQTAAMLAGAVLFAIGLSGRLGFPLYPVQNLSFLMQPMPVSTPVNNIYWTALVVVGV
ncbi:hypothetical protein [Yoonia sp.]|uniref:hypothetical protein n=1 Tax=Yoonia sp. TaxID=2212373 RepID=UPI002FDB72CC